MKKNIEKPNLSVEEKAVMAAQIKAMFQSSARHMKMSWREKRMVKRIEQKIGNGIMFGDWESAMLYAMENKDFPEAFRKTICIVEEKGDAGLRERGLDEDSIQNILLAMRKISKAFEYLTGMDAKTGKKIHKGVIDAD